MAPAEQITGKKIAAADEALRECAAVETELAELRAQYDQYFLGVERKPPTKRHEAIKKQIQGLKNAFIRQTSVRFRIDNLAQKMTTFERLWDRTLKEIEAGTYKRHLFKAKMHAKPEQAAGAKKAAENFDIDEDLDLSDLGDEAPTSGDLASALNAAAATAKSAAAPPAAAALPKPLPSVPPAAAPIAPIKATTVAARPSALALEAPTQPSAPPAYPAAAKKVVSPAVSAPPAAARPAAAAAAPPRPISAQPAAAGNPNGGLSEQKIKAIYDAYVMAKKRCGEDTSKLSLTAVSDTLKKQVPELMKQHKAKSVEFKVVIKDGKAVLRALPKE